MNQKRVSMQKLISIFIVTSFAISVYGMQKPRPRYYNEILGDGTLALQKKEYAKAIHAFREAFDTAPNKYLQAYAAAQLGIAYSRAGNIDPARQYAQFAACQEFNTEAKKSALATLKLLDAIEGAQQLPQEFILKK